MVANLKKISLPYYVYSTPQEKYIITFQENQTIQRYSCVYVQSSKDHHNVSSSSVIQFAE